MTTPFPLLRLSRLALIPVLQHMELIEVIAFSLLSKKARNLSKICRKLSAISMNLFVESDHLYIKVDLRGGKSVPLYFYTESAPQLVNVMSQRRRFTHENSGLSVSQWAERILDVTSCESICHLELKGSPQLDVCDTFGKLKNIWKLYIFNECSDNFAKKALEIILPVTREITFYRIPLKTREEFQTFLKSNLNYLNIHTSTFQKFKFTLDDLLNTNLLKLKLRQVKLSATDISQFLTNWFHSKRNSRLEHLHLYVKRVGNATCLPEVLNAVPFPVNEERTFRYSKQLDTLSESFLGGYDIERADGKKSTTLFGTFYGGTFFDFYVWP
ncbi:hypothetical protein GCK72_021253 [Caenorhabditis remanei]|uniref:F-box domain-containing protein n=1 Tax=Caenorhabditis remanei TaxID=31234 RepID=A0A6A5GK36_CAERE|nr:hypothetical protein GCK72_021253 [Caenorhabditis remanei]KAF1754689.1 hypothetical protein GCK72_021253 [Caenorhabditis remanei]